MAYRTPLSQGNTRLYHPGEAEAPSTCMNTHRFLNTIASGNQFRNLTMEKSQKPKPEIYCQADPHTITMGKPQCKFEI